MCEESAIPIFSLFPANSLKSTSLRKMRIVILPPALAACALLTSRISTAESKILLPSVIADLFQRTQAQEAALGNVATMSAAAVPGDEPSDSGELTKNQLSGQADLKPTANFIEKLATPTLTTDSVPAEAAPPGVATAVVSETADSPAPEPVVSAAPAVALQPLSEDDAEENMQLLQSVSNSAESSWISNVSRQSAIEALLPFVAMAPVLAAAGLHAQVDTSSPGTARVLFPSIDFSVNVEEIKSLV